MIRSRSLRKLIPLILFIVLCASIPLVSFITHGALFSARAASSLPYHEFADGPYKVSGNQIVGADNKQYIFHGVGRDGLEFECTGDAAMDSAHLAFMGPPVSGGLSGTYWWGNTVRLPLSEGFWLHGDAQAQCSAATYQAQVKSVVNSLTALHLNVVIDLMWTDAGGQVSGQGAGFMAPDADSVTFWSQVAPVYKSYTNVLFELYNEPHPNSWSCWAGACAITGDNTLSKQYNYQSVGLQKLVTTVRSAGATNVVIVSGMDWGFDLSLSQQSGNLITDSGKNLAYDTHPYDFGNKQSSTWDAAFGFLTQTAPVMSLENGEYDCGTDGYMSHLIPYFDAHQMSWVGWAWFSTGSTCGYPQIITDWLGTPAASIGTLEYNQLLSYANQGPPTPTPSPTPIPSLGGPVSSIWYFPEGRAGAGFKEWLTLENPNNVLCTVTINYLAQPDGRANYSVTKSVNVPATSRMTEWVDGDLGTSPTGPGISDAAQINVNTQATPNCTGIVAERPMYFNALGTNSGSDVIGMTKLATTFYFGDLAEGAQPGGGSYSSFITILNPVGGKTANVTATYYSNGTAVNKQSIVVPGGSRGTIFPAGVAPARSVVVVTSNQLVAVERPSYFSNINGGQAGGVSGGVDVVGVQKLSNDWLFAEGYTQQQFQENLVIANVDPVNKPATVTITLEFPGGGTKVSTITVNPNSQVIWNVNANVPAPGNSVSAEVTSSGANILVEREMFFKYLHNANGRSLSSMGGSDVLGQSGPAALSNYGFAEGYTNVGYDEWLTIQNPTAATETINIALVNEAGGYYATSITVVGHSRYTVDITGMVIGHLYRSGTGFAGYEVSMVVQSSGVFVAERPIYWNASGTQGGDDVIGYTGG